MLSVTKSLWGRVTPDLRWVSIGLVDDVVVARFAYEDEPRESHLEHVVDAATDVLADLLTRKTDFQAVHRPQAQAPALEDGTHWWAYLRYEPRRMADVVGRTAADALRVLQYDRDKTVLLGQDSGGRLDVDAAAPLIVVGTTPAAGAELPEGAFVTLKVASATNC